MLISVSEFCYKILHVRGAKYYLKAEMESENFKGFIFLWFRVLVLYNFTFRKLFFVNIDMIVLEIVICLLKIKHAHIICCHSEYSENDSCSLDIADILLSMK